MDSDLTTSITILRSARSIYLDGFRKQQEVTSKDKEGLWVVSRTDKEADAYLRAQLAKHHPHDQITSQEHPLVQDHTKAIWFVDALDWTRGYLQGLPRYAVIIGRTRKGQPDLGVVYAPASDEVWYAKKGQGAYHEKDGKITQLQVSEQDELQKATLVVRTPLGNPRPWDKLVDQLPCKQAIEGSSAIKVARLAAGDFDVHVNTNPYAAKWDTCATQVIIEEAGGKMTSMHGKPLDYTQENDTWTDSYVVSNSKLHDVLLAAIKDTQK